MKRLIVAIQIAALISSTAYAGADGTPFTQNQVSTVQQIIEPQRPKNWKPGQVFVLKSNIKPKRNNFATIAWDKVKALSTTFFLRNKETNERTKVEAYAANIGGTFGDAHFDELFEKEIHSKEKYTILYTLDSTMEEAKAFKEQKAKEGVRIEIVSFPDHIAKQLQEKLDAIAAGGLKEFYWNVNQKLHKVTHPRETFSNAAKVIKHQIVEPTQDEIRVTKILVQATAVTGTIGGAYSAYNMGAFSMGVDWRIVMGFAGIVAARIFYTHYYNKYVATIANILRADPFNDVSVVPMYRQVLARMFSFNLVAVETYFGVGRLAQGPSYSFTQQQLGIGLAAGVFDTAQATVRNNKLTREASAKMMLYSSLVGIGIETLITSGLAGPMVYEGSVVQLTMAQVGGLAASMGFLTLYTVFTRKAEAFAHKNPLLMIPGANYLLKQLNKAKEEESKIKKIQNEFEGPYGMCKLFFS